MVFVEGPAMRVAVAFLAGSLGFGGFWSKIQGPVEVPAAFTQTIAGAHVEHTGYPAGLLEAHTREALAVANAVPGTPPPASAAKPEELLQRALLKVVNPEGASVWWLVASCVVDVLFLFLGWRGCRRYGAGPRDEETKASISDNSIALDQDSEEEEEVARNLGDLMQKCSEVFEEGCQLASQSPGSSTLSADGQVHASLLECTEAVASSDAAAAASPNLGLAAYLPARREQDETFYESPPKVSAVVPRASRRKSAGELKEWMVKQREQCEIVENTQALVATDAKACESSRCEGPASPEHLPQGGENEALQAPGAQRSKRRSPEEVKALMKKKREECHVLDESAQEHIDTDAKAAAADTALKPIVPNIDLVNDCAEEDSSVKQRSSSHRSSISRSNKEVQDLMSKLRNQCTISDSADAQFVATDAKAGVHPVI